MDSLLKISQKKKKHERKQEKLKQPKKKKKIREKTKQWIILIFHVRPIGDYLIHTGIRYQNWNFTILSKYSIMNIFHPDTIHRRPLWPQPSARQVVKHCHHLQRVDGLISSKYVNSHPFSYPFSKIDRFVLFNRCIDKILIWNKK